MFFRQWLQHRREVRARVQRDADDLLTFLGDAGYPEARDRARGCRAKHDRAGNRHWTRVAVEIAWRTGIEVGETVADRYAGAAVEPPRPDNNRRLIASNLADLSAALADIARAREDETTLHNVAARVHQTVQVAGATPELQRAGQAVIQAFGAVLARQETVRASLEAGVFPPLIDVAATTLQRLRKLAFPAR